MKRNKHYPLTSARERDLQGGEDREILVTRVPAHVLQARIYIFMYVHTYTHTHTHTHTYTNTHTHTERERERERDGSRVIRGRLHQGREALSLV
jgi:hypothetical protein